MMFGRMCKTSNIHLEKEQEEKAMDDFLYSMNKISDFVFNNYSPEALQGKLQATDYVLYVFHEELAACVKTKVFTQRLNNSILGEIFPRKYRDEQGTLHYVQILRHETIPFDSTDSFVVQAESTEKLSNIMSVINTNGFVPNSHTQKAVYYPNINLSVIYNGRHSSSIGIFKKIGEIKADVIDISELYPHIYTDGVHWIDRHNNEYIGNKIPVPCIAILYETSRIKHNLSNGITTEEILYDFGIGIRHRGAK